MEEIREELEGKRKVATIVAAEALILTSSPASAFKARGLVYDTRSMSVFMHSGVVGPLARYFIITGGHKVAAGRHIK